MKYGGLDLYWQAPPMKRLCKGVLIAISVLTLPVFGALEHLPDEQAMPSEKREILELDAAKQYMLKLINRDRASVGAGPVVMDEIASKAGQLHSDEMAVNGYLSHWTMDGKKPDQRYNDCGGKDAVMENTFITFEGAASSNSKEANKLLLHRSQVFHRYELDKIESSFFNEKPPNDGHRKNIIDPLHTSVGIGLSFASSVGMGSRSACTQEFVNHYGEYGDIPKEIKLGGTFSLTGKLDKGVHLKSVDLRCESMPKPMTVAALNESSSYSMPDKVITSYFADPSQTNDPIPVKKVDDQETFTQAIATDKEWQPGLYYICVWATIHDGDETVISTRTINILPNE